MRLLRPPFSLIYSPQLNRLKPCWPATKRGCTKATAMKSAGWEKPLNGATRSRPMTQKQSSHAMTTRAASFQFVF